MAPVERRHFPGVIDRKLKVPSGTIGVDGPGANSELFKPLER